MATSRENKNVPKNLVDQAKLNLKFAENKLKGVDKSKSVDKNIKKDKICVIYAGNMDISHNLYIQKIIIQIAKKDIEI